MSLVRRIIFFFYVYKTYSYHKHSSLSRTANEKEIYETSLKSRDKISFIYLTSFPTNAHYTEQRTPPHRDEITSILQIMQNYHAANYQRSLLREHEAAFNKPHSRARH